MTTLLKDTHFLFLDRDGVINKRIMGGYITQPKELELLDGVAEAVAVFNQHFEKVFVVTNQQGIGKGLMTTADLAAVHQRLSDILAQANAHIDAFYHCPELASKDNNCRKPAKAMGLQAKADFPEVDFTQSVMVGDSLSDIHFGKALQMKTVLIDNPHFPAHNKHEADLIVPSLWDLAQMLK